MICAILLAAGKSQRMGVQKLLLPFAGQTVVGHIVTQIQASGVVDQTVVVLGSDADSVRAAVQASHFPGGKPQSHDMLFTSNPDPNGDMLSSVRCGLKMLPKECDAVLVVLGDQPAIDPTTIGQMVESFVANKGKIIVPVYQRKQGHPLVFSAQYRDEILSQYDGIGLRGLLQAHNQDLIEVRSDTSTVLSDMDYPEDYRRELQRWQAENQKYRT